MSSDDGGSGIVPVASTLKHLCAPAQHGTAIDDENLVTLGPRSQSGSQPTKTGPNHDDFLTQTRTPVVAESSGYSWLSSLATWFTKTAP